MPVYQLPDEIAFPEPSEAEPDGLLAVGGDLSPERLLTGYSVGIFPWPHEGWPILWFSPDPRMVLFPDELKLSRSLRQTIRKERFEIRLDTDFAGVIAHCAKAKRPGQRGTWITKEMKTAYTNLHELGFAHSAEAWLDGKLVGGAYGVSLGAGYFGESMFALEPDASKVAFAALVGQLKQWGFHFIDAQVHTAHLERFGARQIPRDDYLARLEAALRVPTRRGPWQLGAD
ncbi:MAG: leucyl/phenylalanyl-tRNA--protein transferase [Planctomycetes bacterium]|nr:leucyl/phenylalanyl-tRNA--protein transferase [Planctomycetota bacterium]